MLDLVSNQVLQTVLRRERRSLLQYASEAYPWTTFVDHQLVVQLQAMIQEEQQAIVSLTNFLRRNSLTMQYVDPYPMGFTAYNFVTFEFLLGKIIEDQRKAVTELERDGPLVPDLEAKLQIETLLAINQRHLKTLEGLVAAPKPAGV